MNLLTMKRVCFIIVWSINDSQCKDSDAMPKFIKCTSFFFIDPELLKLQRKDVICLLKCETLKQNFLPSDTVIVPFMLCVCMHKCEFVTFLIITANVKDMYEKALTPPQPSPPPTPQPKRTKADWERDERELLEEKEGLEALRRRTIPKYFESEFGKAFLLTQVNMTLSERLLLCESLFYSNPCLVLNKMCYCAWDLLSPKTDLSTWHYLTEIYYYTV